MSKIEIPEHSHSTASQVTNDDGPPSSKSSPYIKIFVEALEAAGHVISVVLPDVPRSWISKAHIRGVLVQPRYYKSKADSQADSEANESDHPSNKWMLVNGTPAACVQMGLFHLFQDRGPVDLVIAGPNYGRNITSTSSLCSGTIGAALEAALCKKKAVGISFVKADCQDQETIVACSKVSVALIENLYSNWDVGVELYNINVPPVKIGETPRTYYTTVLQNSWSSASIYKEVANPEASAGELPSFAWAPQRQEQLQFIEESKEPTDAWALKMGYIRFVSLMRFVIDPN